MASGDVLPRFFSVYLSHYSSDSLMIPVSYYEHLPHPLPKTAILMGTGGKIWKVAMKSRQEQVYFERGWANFVEDNDLKDGEFLVFVFDGYRRYEVSIFGHGGCKEIRAAVEVEEISDGSESENSESSLESTIQEDQEEETIDADAKSDTDYSPDSPDTTTISVESGEVFNAPATTSRKRGHKKQYPLKHIENPEAYLDDPNNVYFQTCLKDRTYELLVKAQLVKDYCLKFGDYVEYIDRFGTLTGELKRWRDPRVCVNNWNKICDRNKLTENDSILCEILRDGDKLVYAIKIHIIPDGDHT